MCFWTAPDQLELQPIKQISGTVRLPGSKSISNRVLLLAALAEGTTVVKNLLVRRHPLVSLCSLILTSPTRGSCVPGSCLQVNGNAEGTLGLACCLHRQCLSIARAPGPWKLPNSALFKMPFLERACLASALPTGGTSLPLNHHEHGRLALTHERSILAKIKCDFQ